MCNAKLYKNGKPNSRIDKCIKLLIQNIIAYLCEEEATIIGSCCGHGKYPMTIIVREEVYDEGRHRGHIIKDWVSGMKIPRKRKFYKRDKEGYYYIPEVSEVK